MAVPVADALSPALPAGDIAAAGRFSRARGAMRTLEITIPAAEQKQPDAFISRIQRLPIPERLLNSEARVQINEATHTMVISGDCQSP